MAQALKVINVECCSAVFYLVDVVDHCRFHERSALSALFAEWVTLELLLSEGFPRLRVIKSFQFLIPLGLVVGLVRLGLVFLAVPLMCEFPASGSSAWVRWSSRHVVSPFKGGGCSRREDAP